MDTKICIECGSTFGFEVCPKCGGSFMRQEDGATTSLLISLEPAGDTSREDFEEAQIGTRVIDVEGAPVGGVMLGPRSGEMILGWGERMARFNLHEVFCAWLEEPERGQMRKRIKELSDER